MVGRVTMETIRESSDVGADNVSRRHDVTADTSQRRRDVTTDSFARRNDVTADNRVRNRDVTNEAEVRSLLQRDYVPSQFDESRSDASGPRGGGASRAGGAGSSVGGDVGEREIVIIDEKLKWNAKSKIGSLQNSTHKPGGGARKIVNEKLKWDGKQEIYMYTIPVLFHPLSCICTYW